MGDQTSKESTANPDLCEIFCYNADKVDRLRREVAVTEGMALFFKALADDSRLKVLYALSKEELCVCDVAHILGFSVQAASHHLRFLRSVGLAKFRKEGKIVFYSLKDEKTARLIADLIERVKEMKS